MEITDLERPDFYTELSPLFRVYTCSNAVTLRHIFLVPHICVNELGQHWFGAKPSPESILAYCQLDPMGTHLTEILIKIQNFSLTKMHLTITVTS